MKDLLKKLIFMAQFHFKDPDPDSEYGSGFRILIQTGNLNPDPPGSETLFLDVVPVGATAEG